MTEQLNRIEREIGRLSGAAEGILREIGTFGARLDGHIEEDRRLAERVGHAERALARIAGAAGLLATLGAAAGATLVRWFHTAAAGQ